MEKVKKWYEQTWFIVIVIVVVMVIGGKYCMDPKEETPEERVVRLDNEEGLRIQDSIQAVKDSIYHSTPEYMEKKLKQDQLKVIRDIKKDCEYYDVGGYFFQLNWKIQESLNNPDSFEHVRTKMSERLKEGCIYAEVKFRGTNAFNATITQTMYFKLYPGCKVIIVD